MTDRLTRWRLWDRELGPDVEVAGRRWDSAVRALERAEMAEEEAGREYLRLRDRALRRAS